MSNLVVVWSLASSKTSGMHAPIFGRANPRLALLCAWPRSPSQCIAGLNGRRCIASGGHTHRVQPVAFWQRAQHTEGSVKPSSVSILYAFPVKQLPLTVEHVTGLASVVATPPDTISRNTRAPIAVHGQAQGAPLGCPRLGGTRGQKLNSFQLESRCA